MTLRYAHIDTTRHEEAAKALDAITDWRVKEEAHSEAGDEKGSQVAVDLAEVGPKVGPRSGHHEGEKRKPLGPNNGSEGLQSSGDRI